MIPDPTQDTHPFTIPLQCEGVISNFEYPLPTSAKYEHEDHPHHILMALSLAWDRYDEAFATQE